MTHELYGLLHAEISRRSSADATGLSRPAVKEWDNTLSDMIQHAIRYDFPMEEIPEVPSFNGKSRHARNAFEALFAVRAACAQRTQSTLTLKWTDECPAGGLLARLIGQRGERQGFPLLLRCLNFLAFAGVNLESRDLREAHLNHVDLSKASLRYADLREASLVGATLIEADFQGGNLRGAGLRRALLEGARLNEIDLERANLRGAQLSRAKCDGASLRNANLSGANLESASLVGADLRGANLASANFTNADLTGANLSEISQSALRGAEFLGANVSGAVLPPIKVQERARHLMLGPVRSHWEARSVAS
jgi:uncharacterized protein YjbI with pentapeptide repeats